MRGRGEEGKRGRGEFGGRTTRSRRIVEEGDGEDVRRVLVCWVDRSSGCRGLSIYMPIHLAA